MRRQGQCCHRRQTHRAAAIAKCQEPQYRAKGPQRQRHRDQVLRTQRIHAQQQQQATDARADQVSKIDAVEDGLGALEHHPQKQGSGQKGRQIEHEVERKAPLLHRVGDQKDGVEGKLLCDQVRGHRQRTEGQQRRGRQAAPVAVEPLRENAHHRAGQAEAEHRQAHHQRTEVRPAANRKNAHDGDLQCNHGAGHKADREVHRHQGARAEASRSRDSGAHRLWVPLISSLSSLVKGTNGTMRPP